MNGPDFIVFGAPKSGTTTLFEYLDQSASICLPKDKEAPYFCDERLYSLGVKYLDSQYQDCKPNQITGSISPQYSIGQGDVYVDEVARRISSQLPNVKLISLLRDPIQRAVSHHQMLTARGHEHRTLSKALDDCTNGSPLLPGYPDPDMDYIKGSKYQAILETYLKHFSRSQIHVTYTEDLFQDPDQTLRDIFEFLELDYDLSEAITPVQARKGGSKPRLKFLTPGFLFRIAGVRSLWKTLPASVTKPIEYRLNLWNLDPDSAAPDLNTLEFEHLADEFRSDIKYLQEFSGNKPPWSDRFSL